MSRYETVSGFKYDVGTIIDKKYELIKPIGSGASCTVWEAKNLYGDYKCAIKFLNSDRAAFENGKDEFGLLNQIYHPNIIRTFDMDEINGTHQAYMSMELMNGKSFDQVIKNKDAIPGKKIYKWLFELVSALKYLKKMRIIHKDIKPGNIMFEGDRCVLIDFNISLTASHTFGTLAYKAPSVDQDMRWTYNADAWALAVSFYEVLALEYVFDTSTSYDAAVLDVKCPAGFPENTFERLKAIINGEGRDGDIDDLYEFFGVREDIKRSEIPSALAEKFDITSKNQHFVTLHFIGLPDPTMPKSKIVVLKDALHDAGLSAAAKTLDTLKGVLSQLKGKGVLEYSGKGNKKIMMAKAFMDELNKYS